MYIHIIWRGEGGGLMFGSEMCNTTIILSCKVENAVVSNSTTDLHS